MPAVRGGFTRSAKQAVGGAGDFRMSKLQENPITLAAYFRPMVAQPDLTIRQPLPDFVNEQRGQTLPIIFITFAIRPVGKHAPMRGNRLAVDFEPGVGFPQAGLV